MARTIKIDRIDRDHMEAVYGDCKAIAYYDRDHGANTRGWAIDIYERTSSRRWRRTRTHTRLPSRHRAHAAVERAMRYHLRDMLPLL
jgi:hypothetical protein